MILTIVFILYLAGWFFGLWTFPTLTESGKALVDKILVWLKLKKNG